MKNKHHYVYRITNIQEKKHYYGVRSSEIEPKLDLGIKYFSSSSDKEFIKKQKENKSLFKYKIIKQFDSREEAINLEIKLHAKFNVGINELFYNKSKQTSKGFDTTGITYSNERKEQIHKRLLENNPFKGKQHTEEVKNFLSVTFKNMFGTCEHCGKEGQYHLIEQWYDDNCTHHTDIVVRNKNIEYMKGVSERKSGEKNPMFGRHGKDNRKSFKYELYDSNNVLIDACYGADISNMLKQNECPCSFRYMDGAYNYTGNSPIRYKSKHGWYLKTIKDWWIDEK